MCLIVCHLKGASPMPRADLEEAWKDNPHGAGYMFVHAGKLVIRKPFFTFEALAEAYYADHAQYGAESDFVLHLRYATHGEKDELNTHPHLLATSDGVEAGLVHNGILPMLPPKGAGISDTVFFCGTVLAMRPSAQLLSPEYGTVLGEMIGKGNKLVILAANGGLSIVNEGQGEWDGQTWYSNTYWREKAADESASLPSLAHWHWPDTWDGQRQHQPALWENEGKGEGYYEDDEELDEYRKWYGVDFANWDEVEAYEREDHDNWSDRLEAERLEIEAAFDRAIA